MDEFAGVFKEEFRSWLEDKHTETSLKSSKW